MRMWRTGVFVMAGLVPLVGPAPVAWAGPARPAGLEVVTPGANRTLVTDRPSSQFFSGDSGFVRTFSLVAGDYFIDVYAQYDALNDPDGSGKCSFEGSFDNLGSGESSRLGHQMPLVAGSPYSQTAKGHLPGDIYKLTVSPFTTCDWRMSIVPIGSSSPSISIGSVGVYLQSSGKLVQTTVVPMGPTVYFIVSYNVTGKLPATLAGELTLQEKSGPIQKAAHRGENGIERAYLAASFSASQHDVPGPAVATFTLTSGYLRAIQSLHFTLQSPLSIRAG